MHHNLLTVKKGGSLEKPLSPNQTKKRKDKISEGELFIDLYPILHVANVKQIEDPIEDISVVSHFAGCGGMDLGFHGDFCFKDEYASRHPFKILSAYDHDAKCIQTYTKNLSGNITLTDLSTAKAAEMPKADVLIGGFPCQDFSSCGPKAGLGSERGRLYLALVDYMMVHRPKVVVAENVPHLKRIGGGSVIKTIIKDLEEAGYRFQIWDLYAPDFGVPQNRTRLFLVGVRDDLQGAPTSPLPTHERSAMTIDWALEDLEEITDESVPNQSQYFLASKAKNGNGQGDEVSKLGRPAYTVRANAKSRVQFHYRLPRRLTVRECARLQTFPDDFVFSHSATANIMQIGNAVPPLLAHCVASSVASFLKNLLSSTVVSERVSSDG